MTAQEFRKALMDLGLRQNWLAENLGVHFTTVSRWATGELPVPAYAVFALTLLRERRHYLAANHELTAAAMTSIHMGAKK
jgi:DNA-binding transcriptional regulator YiaG